MNKKWWLIIILIIIIVSIIAYIFLIRKQISLTPSKNIEDTSSDISTGCNYAFDCMDTCGELCQIGGQLDIDCWIGCVCDGNQWPNQDGNLQTTNCEQAQGCDDFPNICSSAAI